MFRGNSRRKSSREREEQIQKHKKGHAYWFKNQEPVWAREVGRSDPVRTSSQRNDFELLFQCDGEPLEG